MKKRLIQKVVFVVVCCSVALGYLPVLTSINPVGASATDRSGPMRIWRSAANAQEDLNPALNTPDKFNWGLFVQINQKASIQNQVGPKKVTTNNAIWETWADDLDTFPSSPDPSKCSGPNPDPKNCPVWPTAAAPELKILTPSPKEIFRQQLRFQRLTTQRELLRLQEKEKAAALRPLIQPVGGAQETRRNKPAFDFIVKNNLWYTQGLKAAFDRGEPVSFPVDAIEIKADWVPITPDQMSRYHWNYDATGKLFGMVALHIISKAVPNWTWATFEWVSNEGRCDYIGCHDKFGSIPQDVPPNAKNNQGYPAGQLTPELLAMFQSAGLGQEWQNYRLKGSQTDFTEPTGKITRLGNSITEAGFVQTSSCMTCHAQASVDSSGDFNPTVGFTPDGQSTNGAPNPDWFYNTNSDPWTVKYLPIDFVWGILRVRPAPGP